MEYQIYQLTATNQVHSEHIVDFQNDADAYAAIPKTLGDQPSAELWCGRRRVGRWTPMPATFVRGDWIGDGAPPATRYFDKGSPLRLRMMALRRGMLHIVR
jgi:hypothetical protein